MHGLYFGTHVATGLLGNAAPRLGRWVTLGVVVATGLALPVAAQEGERSVASTALLEEVIVTARKRDEPVQDVPIAITAFPAEQLDALKIRDLSNLSVRMPNVALDDIRTFPTTANFSIRGLGVNSSIPSIDPTVGVFIDGVYQGQNAGVVIDMSDIRSIEVLRGPQGTLFGRNVTGGAILINTRRPGEELDLSARVAVDGNPSGDGGLNYYVTGAIGGPLSPTFSARLSAYYNKDDGWFVNKFSGRDFGEMETKIIRPVLAWNPNDDVSLVLRWEHMTAEGQGAPTQTHANGSGIPGAFANFRRDSFDFSIDGEGFVEVDSDLVTLELNWDVPFGNGTVTNIAGYKDFRNDGFVDVDGQPVWLFHGPNFNEQEQVSNELRYFGTFGKAAVTTGIYYFDNEILYHEARQLLGIATGGVAPALTQDGGGDYHVESRAWFGSLDYDFTDAWTLNVGLRYTSEDKDVKIASLVRNVNRPCNVVEGTCPYDFSDQATWNSWSGKLGATWNIRDNLRTYAHWSRSQRSGGYNLRNAAIDTVNFGPGPFDEETVDNYELGLKTEIGDRGRLNAALFYMLVDDMQREVNLPDPTAGIVQVIRNTADAEIPGFEFEGMFGLTPHTVLSASVGWIDAKYRDVFFDLNGDGTIDGADEDLRLPRAAEWTWSLSLDHETNLGAWGSLATRVSYAYRDEAAFSDNNLGYLLEQDILDAGLDLRSASGRWTLSLYGRNLLNSVNHGADFQLPAQLGPVPVGGTFSPLIKGRVVGLELSVRY